MTFALTLIPYQPAPEGNLNINDSYHYMTTNPGITPVDLVYTGSTVGEVTGAKTGTIYNGPIMRSSAVSSDGYAFYNPNNIHVLATQINGNPNYVVGNVEKTVLSKTVGGGMAETWVWARDLGYSSGATVDYSAVPGQKDETGLPKGKVTFHATNYPEALFSNNNGTTPTTAEKDEPITIHVFGQEFDPYAAQIRCINDLK